MDQGAPYVRDIQSRVAQALSAEQERIKADEDPADWENLRWQDEDGAHWLLNPVREDFVLLLRAEHRVSDSELAMLGEIRDVLVHCLDRLQPRHRAKGILRRGSLWLGLLAVLLLALVPLPQSVLAPAEVVPEAPLVIASPLQGVVSAVHVAPAQPVQAGDLLLSLDDRELVFERAALREKLALQTERIRRAAQDALRVAGTASSARLLETERAQTESELTYLDSILQRTEVRAPFSGVVLFSSPEQWTSRPVQRGERIMELADVAQVALEVHMAADDPLPVVVGDRVRFFAHALPTEAIEAQILSVSPVTEVIRGEISYRIRARWIDANVPVQIGWLGTARIYGPTQPVGLTLLRRPLRWLRMTVGL